MRAVGQGDREGGSAAGHRSGEGFGGFTARAVGLGFGVFGDRGGEGEGGWVSGCFRLRTHAVEVCDCVQEGGSMSARRRKS